MALLLVCVPTMSHQCNRGEEIRLRHRYRDLILRGRVRLPLAVARKLIGPDCAYHLYRTIGAGSSIGDQPSTATEAAESETID